ncbi:MAG: hypothetical protein WBA71_06540 [Candidatus Humimicrobiia bacterium]
MKEAYKDMEMPHIIDEIANNKLDDDDSERAKWLVKEANSNLYIIQALNEFLDEAEDFKKDGLNPEPFDIFEIIRIAQYKCNMDYLREALRDIKAEMESGKK